MSRIALLSGLLLAVLASHAPPTPSPVPDWLVDQIVQKTADGGRWITDNADYREQDGGIEEYGLEWRPGIGGLSMSGRLFGLRGGQEVGTYWEFRVFWHPGLGEARIYQFGADGTVGIGSMDPPAADGTEIMVQDFHQPDGATRRVRHLSVTEGDREEGRSEDWVGGRWEPRRSYVWYRQRP